MSRFPLFYFICIYTFKKYGKKRNTNEKHSHKNNFTTNHRCHLMLYLSTILYLIYTDCVFVWFFSIFFCMLFVSHAPISYPYFNCLSPFFPFIFFGTSSSFSSLLLLYKFVFKIVNFLLSLLSFSLYSILIWYFYDGLQ